MAWYHLLCLLNERKVTVKPLSYSEGLSFTDERVCLRFCRRMRLQMLAMLGELEEQRSRSFAFAQRAWFG